MNVETVAEFRAFPMTDEKRDIITAYLMNELTDVEFYEAAAEYVKQLSGG